jgi:hypothetical protein
MSKSRDVREVPVQLPDGRTAYITYVLDVKSGKWVSLVEHQTMLDLQAYLNGDTPKQEYVKPWEGDVLNGPSTDTGLI